MTWLNFNSKSFAPITAWQISNENRLLYRQSFALVMTWHVSLENYLHSIESFMDILLSLHDDFLNIFLKINAVTRWFSIEIFRSCHCMMSFFRTSSTHVMIIFYRKSFIHVILLLMTWWKSFAHVMKSFYRKLFAHVMP